MGEAAHARLGPSNHRWPHCPGSVREEANYPDIPSEAAIDGTGSHLLLELCLTNAVPASSYVGHVIGADHPEKPNGWMVAEDRAERVQMCLDYVSRRVRELRAMYPDSTVRVECESRANPGELCGRSDWWGTCDITITVVNRHNRCLVLEIIDYKDGQGYVDEKENTQLESYAIGKAAPWVGNPPVTPGHVLDVVMTVVQPKTNKVVRSSKTTGVDLFSTRFEKLANAARATDDPNAPLIPDRMNGKGYCRWCKHRNNCVALRDTKLQEIANVSELVTYGEGGDFFGQLQKLAADVATLDNAQLTKLYDVKPLIDQVFTNLEAELTKRVEQGGVDGFDLGGGRASKIWNTKDEAVIVKKLKSMKFTSNEIYPPSLVSPAQALKNPRLSDKQRETLEKEFIITKAGNAKLRRVAFNNTVQKVSAEEMFASVGTDSGATAVEALSFFDSAPATSDEMSFFDPPTVEESAPTVQIVPTDKATTTYEKYLEAGWTDQLLEEHGVFQFIKQ